MQFNSLIFFFFLPVFFMGWSLTKKHHQARWIFLTAMSFLFYGWWDWRFLFLIMFSGLIDYTAAWAMTRYAARRRLLLMASLAGNLGTLAVFKYMNFFMGSLANIGVWINTTDSFQPLNFILPVGISFYTFQSMSYTIDVYRGELKPTRNLFHFFAFLSMFPQLVAGPIVRASDMLGQLETSSPSTETQRWDGFGLVVQGFFKKVVIADNLAPVINQAFAIESPYPSTTYWWIIMVMFSFQIYCDFSGYSDIARGLIRWMGYDIKLNFNHPYIASSFQDFWQRWHISLSTWFKDYLYIPLGGSRKGSFCMHRNLWITLVLSGLWHGAAWTFIGWALLHCVYLSIEKLTHWPEKLNTNLVGKLGSTLMVFGCVSCAWVFFRAASYSQAFSILSVMFSFENLAWHHFSHFIGYQTLFFLLIALSWESFIYLNLPNSLGESIARPLRSRFFQMIQLTALLFFALATHGPGSTFIYFQF